MKRPIHIAIVFIAIYAICTGAIGQKVYRCGSTYSQTPCANAVAVDVEDTRSQAQKAESEALTRRETSAANKMEKTRLQEEARDRLERQASQPTAPGKKTGSKPSSSKAASSPGDAEATATSSKKSHSQKKKDSEFFTARATTEQPKAKTKTKADTTK